MAKAIVAGGAGFIGSHLVCRLLASGYEVIVIDNLITGARDNLELAKEAYGHKLSIRILDCNNASTWETLDEADEVYHLATPAAPQDYLSHPLETMKSGSLSVLYALDYCRQKGARILYTSTSEVYGDPLVNPQPETYWGNVNPIGPRSVYDESKRYAEALMMASHRTYGLDTRLVRIFNTYGPGMRELDGRAVPNFILQALREHPISIYGDGNQTRSFCFYRDTIDALLTVMQKGDHMPYNIGNPDMMTINQLAGLIIELTKSRSSIAYQMLPENDPKVRCPDITRIKTLGWSPHWGIREGLGITIDWMREKHRL